MTTTHHEAPRESGLYHVIPCEHGVCLIVPVFQLNVLISSYDLHVVPQPAGHTIVDTPRHVATQGDNTLVCVLSPARALRAPAPCRAEQPRVTSRSAVLRAFRPSRAPLTARSGVGLSPSLLTPRFESALQHLRSSRFGVAAPLLVVPRKSPRASSIAHRIWPSDATSSRLHVTLTAFSTMT